MLSERRVLIAALVLNASFLASQMRGGTILGKVTDTANHPVPSAVITISEEPASLSVPPAMHGASTRTAFDGTFAFGNLEAGTYLLCAQLPRGTLLNPCQWTTTLPHVTIGSATATTPVTLTMRPGYRLPIRVNDPQGLLNANEGKTPGAHLLIGVHGGYHFEMADIDSADAAGRNVSVLVPFDVAVAVSVQSRFFQVQDAAGNAVKNAVALPVTVRSAAPSASLSIKVVGHN
jgi:hypothetical protein